ncbi:hypothetical protein NQ317_008837 [Molorchus minor]|uniref:Alpha-ketoglutarate-dependent dioxygenase AlkB-like domain-containing protein n=1 Tax=Molorchus minor TaxID=1323400 RepID=A0ABQ9IY87_9CUCU|nr:hypothetical protein NQ317_008837 [Molorchus minor]
MYLVVRRLTKDNLKFDINYTAATSISKCLRLQPPPFQQRSKGPNLPTVQELCDVADYGFNNSEGCLKKLLSIISQKNPLPDLDNVLDLNKIYDLTQIKRLDHLPSKERSLWFGLKPCQTWDIFELTERPGLIFIRNPFTGIGQRYWTVRCLRDYSRKPNKTNIDAFDLLANNIDWWDICQNNSDGKLLNKLRWVTLGYHHNWDTKMYSDENRGEFPKDLHEMTVYLAEILGFSHYSPEAAIVNYYHMDSTLSGHTDHSEQNIEAPLFSYSFGQTAIFLIGGKTKEEKPIPIFIRSGDIIVMTKESRVAYHGIPKILKADSHVWNLVDIYDSCNMCKEHSDVIGISKDEFLWKPFGDYLNNSRINVNVRQVLNRGKRRLNSDIYEYSEYIS